MLEDGSDTEEAEREDRLGFSWSKRNIKKKNIPRFVIYVDQRIPFFLSTLGLFFCHLKSKKSLMILRSNLNYFFFQLRYN